jgi:3-hydroxyacyl-CoA dehydrogenase
MHLNDAIQNVAVLGAAGKMGNGIALLVLQEMAILNARESGLYSLKLIDSNERAHDGLRKYLRIQIIKFAEKNIIALREFYKKNAELVSNEEIIRNFVESSLDFVSFRTDIEGARDAKLVFEAIIEDINVKIDVYKKLKTIVDKKAYFFTNTSSIPISLLNEKADLQNRIIGFHFYNPPAIQKLIEIVAIAHSDPELITLSHEIARRFHKIIVQSNDIAGFIGNGHFIREVVFSCERALELSRSHSLSKSIYFINRVTQDFLIRPMGIFQLVDYVGVDVVIHIAEIMQEYISGSKFSVDVLKQFLKEEIRGGQYFDGSQKEGIFQYENHLPCGIYSFEEKRYIVFEENNWSEDCDLSLGPLPMGHFSWKILTKDPLKNEKLTHYLQSLFQSSSTGAELSQKFLINSNEIAKALVKDNVAHSIEDVNSVLINGFFHLYGPNFYEKMITQKGGHKDL